jgi:hypothetical protein
VLAAPAAGLTKRTDVSRVGTEHWLAGILRRFVLLDNAEQVAIGILQDYEIRTLSISPWVPPRTYPDQPLYLTLSVVSIEI